MLFRSSEIRLEEETQEPLPEIYDVTVSVQNGSFEGPETAEQGSDYTGTVQAAEGYRLPETITVKVAGQELAASAYDYDAAVGTVSIPGEQVNGDLEIMVSCAAAEDQPGQSGDDQKPGEDQPGQSGDDQQPGSDSQNQDQQQNQGGKDPQGSDSSVKTGDASTAGMWAVLAVAAAAGAAGVLVWRRKTVQK